MRGSPLVHVAVGTVPATSLLPRLYVITPAEWSIRSGEILARLHSDIDAAVKAAMEAERQHLYAAGPKGKLP